MKKIGILVLCAAMVMAFVALAVFAEGEPSVQGFAYAEDKTVFSYVNAEASAVSVKIYAGLEDAEALGTYPMTLGENGVWSVAVAGDQQNRYYTFVYTAGETSVEIPDPTNAIEGQARSYIPAVVKYELWVAGIQVNNFNAGDILGGADEGASVRYDAAANTLIFAMGTNIKTEELGISYLGSEKLTLKLEGDARITSAKGAIQTAASLTVTADEPSVLYAITDGAEGAGILMGINATLSLENRAIVHAGSAKKAGLQMSAGAALQLGQKNVLAILGGGDVADLLAADETFTIPMEWITTGKFQPMSGRPGVKLTIGDDPQPYTFVGYPGDQRGIAINAETADHSVWLTQSTWETGYGYVAYTKTEETRKAVLYNAKLNSIYGSALSFGEQTEILLRGKNILTGTTAGLEVTSATLGGYHGMLVANGIKIGESLVIKEGALELESDKPVFGDILPDLSQYNGEYVLVTETEKPQPPAEETPETPPEGSETPPKGGETPPEGGETPPEGGETPSEGGETPSEGGEGSETETPAEPQIDLLTEEETTVPGETPEEETKPFISYKLTPQRDHAMDPWVEGSKPNCVTDGTAGHQKCTVCQLYLDASGNEIPANYLPVDYDSHDFTYSALEEKDVHLSSCSRNPAHVYTMSCFGGAEICLQRRVCEGCGQKHGDRLFHIFSNKYTESDEVGHWGMCQRPGCTTADEPKAHSGGFVSCNDPYICEVCGHEYGGIAGHSYTDKASDQLASEATCAQQAKYYAQCDHCDAVSEDVTVSVGEKPPHTYQEAWATNNAGHWHVCTVCGGISTPERHVEIVIGQQKATANAPGYTGDVYCQICNALVFRGSEIPQLAKKELVLEPMVIVAICALAVSALGFGGVIVFGMVKKKKSAQ